MPAQFLVTFARAMVDAGADVFAGHGPHVLRGVEIYKGKPILYSLGDFIFQNETLLRLPSENYETYDLGADAHVADFNDRRYQNDKAGFPADRLIWEAMVAVPRFDGHSLRELALHPITLGFGGSRTARGRPMLAEGALGDKILADVERLSKPFGTRMTTRNGVASGRDSVRWSANDRPSDGRRFASRTCSGASPTEHYVADYGLAVSVFLAIRLGRPLFLEGRSRRRQDGAGRCGGLGARHRPHPAAVLRGAGRQPRRLRVGLRASARRVAHSRGRRES